MSRAATVRGYDAPGIAAVILAAALGVGWCASIVIAALPITDTISETGAALLNGIGQVLAGAVATYLGSTIGVRRATEPAASPEPPTSTPSPRAPVPGA